MSIFWKPGIKDIQNSPNVFVVSYMDEEEIKARYPDIDISAGNADDIFHYVNYGKDIDDTDEVKKRISDLEAKIDPVDMPSTASEPEETAAEEAEDSAARE
jgi:hypothetical protein